MVRKWSAVAFVALLALSSGALAQLSALANIGAPHDKNLEALLDAGKADEAARYWGENRSYFWDNAETLKPLLARLKTAVNTPHEERMGGAEVGLKALGPQ